jgi:hypothetical protein
MTLLRQVRRLQVQRKRLLDDYNIFQSILPNKYEIPNDFKPQYIPPRQMKVPAIPSRNPTPHLVRYLAECMYEPDVFQLHAALTAGRVKDAWAIYKYLWHADQMSQIPPDIHTRLLDMCSKMAHTHTASLIASFIKKNMREAGIRFSNRDYLLLMRIFYRNGDLGRVVNVFFIDAKNQDRVVPSPEMFQLLMLAYARGGCRNESLLLYKEMIEVHPFSEVDAVARSILIDAFGFSRELSCAVEIFKDSMRNSTNRGGLIKKDPILFEAMIRAYGFNDEIKEAWIQVSYGV